MKKRMLIIAEIGTSHGGDLIKAKELVKAASESGADCIKFQWVYADEILHPNTGFVKLPGGDIPLYERFKQLEVKPEFFSDIQEYVHSLGKLFMCSPFGIKSLKELFAINPDYIKIASPELNHTPLLQSLLELELTKPKHHRVPIVLSSGVSTIKDIEDALTILSPLIKENLVSLLHCVTSYPAPVEDYNLNLLHTLKDRFKISMGVSDHSLDPIIIPLLSLSCGANILEKHITLTNTTDGLDDPVALEPSKFKLMVDTIRIHENKESDDILKIAESLYGDTIIKAILGTGKKELALSERDNYGRTNRSIHFMHDMKKGDIISKDDIAILRTEKVLTVGIEPCNYEKVLGKVLAKNVTNGEGLVWSHLIK